MPRAEKDGIPNFESAYPFEDNLIPEQPDQMRNVNQYAEVAPGGAGGASGSPEVFSADEAVVNNDKDWQKFHTSVRDKLRGLRDEVRLADNDRLLEIEDEIEKYKDGFQDTSFNIYDLDDEAKQAQRMGGLGMLNGLVEAIEGKIERRSVELKRSKSATGTKDAKDERIAGPDLEVLRTYSIERLLKEWFTRDITEGVQRANMGVVLKERIKDIEDEFLQGAVTEADKKEAEQRYLNFIELVKNTDFLIDFGVFRHDTTNTAQLTAKHDKLMERSTIPGAMKINGVFNNLELVGGIKPDRSELFTRKMGLIQKIVFAMYQEMRKTKDESNFSRNEGYSGTKSDDLVDFICGLNEFSTFDGRKYKLDIKKELDKFPKDAQDVIKMVAAFKASRDDIGSKAGIWHLGYNKGAFKYADGASGRPSGVLAAIFYQVGKNSTRENHAALLDFVNPLNNELAAHRDAKDKEVARFSEQADMFRLWSNPQWENVRFNKFTPDHWHQDFPGLDYFFGQSEEATMPGDYTKSRDAVLKMLEMATSSRNMNLSPITDQMVEKIQVEIKTFSTEIGKALAFIGGYGEKEEQKCVHELILAAYQYYISNILMSVPGMEPLINPFGLRTMERKELFNVAVATIRTTLNNNSTLSGFYHANLTGKKTSKTYNGDLFDFIGQDSFRRVWRDEPRLRNIYQGWRLENDPVLKNIGFTSQARQYETAVKDPINVKEGWKSSYHDAPQQKT